MRKLRPSTRVSSPTWPAGRRWSGNSGLLDDTPGKDDGARGRVRPPLGGRATVTMPARKKRTAPTNFAASPLPVIDRSTVPRPATSTVPRPIPATNWIRESHPAVALSPIARVRWGASLPLGSSGLYVHDTRTGRACQGVQTRFLRRVLDRRQPAVRMDSISVSARLPRWPGPPASPMRATHMEGGGCPGAYILERPCWPNPLH